MRCCRKRFLAKGLGVQRQLLPSVFLAVVLLVIGQVEVNSFQLPSTRHYGTAHRVEYQWPLSVQSRSRKRIDVDEIIVVTNNEEEKRLSLPVGQSLDYNPSQSGSFDSYQYLILGLLWLIAVLSALDRVAMSVALVPISSEFAFSDTMKGSISSFFSVGYGLAILPVGVILAALSPSLVMACGMALWSTATILTPFAADVAGTMMPLLIVRAFVGAGESLVLPTVQRLLAVWTTAEQKSLALACVFSGFHAGTIIAYLVSPIIIDDFDGWRTLFYVYGGFGLLLLVPWMLYAKDSPQLLQTRGAATPFLKGAVASSTVAPAAVTIPVETKTLKDRLDDSVQIFKDAPWAQMAKSKGSWAVLLAHCAKNWGLYNSLAWTPTFYAEQYGIGVRDSAWLSLLPSVTGAIGGFLAGTAADSILSNMNDITEESRTKVRKAFQAVGLYGPAVALGALAWQTPEEAWVAQAFLMVSVGLQAFNIAGFEAAIQEKAGPKWAGLLYSITSLPAIMLGTFGVYATGRVLDLTGQDWSIVFAINSFINILGASAFIWLYDSKKEFD